MNIATDKFDYSRLLGGNSNTPRLSTWIIITGLLLCAAALVVLSVVHAPGIDRYRPLVQKYALPAGVEQELVLAMISVESKGRTRAVSRKGAAGLMQIMPSTAQQIALENGVAAPSVDDLFDPDTNIRLGVAYLSNLLKRYDNDTTLALGAYNAGPRKIREWMSANPGLSSRELCLTAFYPETRQYVISVLKKQRDLMR